MISTDSTYLVCLNMGLSSLKLTAISLSVSHKYTLLTPEEEKFVPNMSSNANRMEIRQNWDMLMPRKIYDNLESHEVY